MDTYFVLTLKSGDPHGHWATHSEYADKPVAVEEAQRIANTLGTLTIVLKNEGCERFYPEEVR